MKRILIVDDEIGFCFSVKKNLEAAGDFEVEVCPDSKVAVKKAKDLRPDLILLDILMPGLSGSEVAARLKNDEDTKAIPVVFLTALITEEEAEEKQDAVGGQHFIAKPVETKELLRVINSITK